MAKNFINVHSHIFTANHAPDYFLKTVIHNTTCAEWVDRFLQKDGTRWLMKGFLTAMTVFNKSKRSVVKRYIEFLEIGTSATQSDIYRTLSKSYVKFGDFKIVTLSQVLDYLDLERSSTHVHIQTQVEQMAELRRDALYQKSICPFLGVDPRQTGFDLVKDWAEKYISKQYGFCGLKIYPAAGFFPFDTRLDALWAWAEENQVPVMTHCTRGGSFYLGRFESIFTSPNQVVNSLNPASPHMPSIKQRITEVCNEKSIQKQNIIWCNVFGHPENYRPVLEKYPRLKLCLAHFGGSDEVLRSKFNKNQTDADKKLGGQYPDFFKDNWSEHVVDLMAEYENVYSDISYTLSDKRTLEIIRNTLRDPSMVDKLGNPLMQKLMYGTDFYLTQQEEKGDEPDLEQIFLTTFNAAETDLLAYTNPAAYLSSKLFP